MLAGQVAGTQYQAQPASSLGCCCHRQHRWPTTHKNQLCLANQPAGGSLPQPAMLYKRMKRVALSRHEPAGLDCQSSHTGSVDCCKPCSATAAGVAAPACCSQLLWCWHIQLELWWQLILAVQLVTEVDAAHAAVGMHLHTQRLHVVGSVRPAYKVCQVKLDLVPAVI